MRRPKPCSSRRGTALVLATVLVASLASLSVAVLMGSMASARERRSRRESIEARYVAEAALAQSLTELQQGKSGDVGSRGQPVRDALGTYWVERASPGAGLVSLTASGSYGGSSECVEIVLRSVSGSPFSWAAFGDEDMTLDSNAQIDSYDSTLGSYADQAVNTYGGNSYARADGDIGSNKDIVTGGNAIVWGDASSGPTGSVTQLHNSEIKGSSAPAGDVTLLDPLEIPVLPLLGDLTVSSNGTQLVSSGDYAFGALEVQNGGTLIIEGPATLVFDSAVLRSSSQILVDADAGPVEIYVLTNFVMNSNTRIASLTEDPLDVRIHLESDNILDPDAEVDLDEVDLDSNAQLFGTLYAPNARVEINSNFELFGALVARQVHLDSNARIHFDEALLTADQSGGEATWEKVYWMRRPCKD